MWLHGCRWNVQRRPTGHIWVCFPHRRRSRLLEFDTTINCHPLHRWSRIRRSNSSAKEAVWLREFISEVDRPQDPMPLHSDSQSAIALTCNKQFHARTKHINIRFHFIRYIIEAGKIIIDYCPTEDMVADTLTVQSSPKRKGQTLCFGSRPTQDLRGSDRRGIDARH